MNFKPKKKVQEKPILYIEFVCPNKEQNDKSNKSSESELYFYCQEILWNFLNLFLG